MQKLTNPIDEVNQTDSGTETAYSEQQKVTHGNARPEIQPEETDVKLMTLEERQKLRRRILAHGRAFK